MTHSRSAAVKQDRPTHDAPGELAGVTVVEYQLIAVARRLHEDGRCVCCGTSWTLWRVNVEAIADGRRTVIVCQQCAARSEDRAWRLRWRVTPYER